ncbi:hypothetical protein R1flu_010134 [Riccia fluitans]|uniref:Uncharacterized protein n=1 Tax=Riccia fluitans TaxID=41844 RepID=A0ABD1Z754_9MARC
MPRVCISQAGNCQERCGHERTLMKPRTRTAILGLASRNFMIEMTSDSQGGMRAENGKHKKYGEGGYSCVRIRKARQSARPQLRIAEAEGNTRHRSNQTQIAKSQLRASWNEALLWKSKGGHARHFGARKSPDKWQSKIIVVGTTD